MSLVTGDRYLDSLVKFVDKVAGQLIDGTLVLKLNPVGLHYVQSRLEALAELENLLAAAPVDYLRAYVSDLGDHRAIEHLRRILRLLPSLKLVSVLPPSVRDPTPLSLLPFGRLRVLELRGCDLSTSAARGLLEMRHTLEKFICHNSTDALRHVFASRIAEIKDSPQWNRLYSVSCACNGLFLMDDSLKLLPAVETLDLSRNKFTKVDNLRKCTKLKHLDLGYNHLRTITSLKEVPRQIVKLVLRSNALTTLRGIENLLSLEGLDLAYNIVSNFSELAILSGLSSLKTLWLEGNPICSARWYRAQVFSFFPHPEEMELDEKKICTREFWKRQIIVASRKKQPASFGFYFTANENTGKVNTNSKPNKLSRLANIETEEQSTYMWSDQESLACEQEFQGKKDNAALDDEAEIVDLMNRIEFMKKEHSILWLEELKEWINQASEFSADGAKYSGDVHTCDEANYKETKARHEHLGESSRCIAKSVQASGEETGGNIVMSDNSSKDIYPSFGGEHCFDQIGGEAALKMFIGPTAGVDAPCIGRSHLNQGYLKSHYTESDLSLKPIGLHLDPCAVQGVDTRMKNSGRHFAAIDDIMESQSSFACLGSPPHYEEDILHRRQNLEEEFLQLPDESYSMASTDSNTSDADDDSAISGEYTPQVDSSVIDELSDVSVEDCNSSVLDHSYKKRQDASQILQNGSYTLDSHFRRNSSSADHAEPDTSPLSCGPTFCGRDHDSESTLYHLTQEADWLQKENCKRKSKRRVVSLEEKNILDNVTVPSHKDHDGLDVLRENLESGNKEVSKRGERLDCKNALAASNLNDDGNIISETKLEHMMSDDFVVNYFNPDVPDSVLQETCRQYVC